MGRVLDALSCYLNIGIERTYDGEPAMKLERYLLNGKDEYEFKTEIIEGDLTVKKINEIMASNDSQEQKQKKLFEIFKNENAVKSILDNYKND